MAHRQVLPHLLDKLLLLLLDLLGPHEQRLHPHLLLRIKRGVELLKRRVILSRLGSRILRALLRGERSRQGAKVRMKSPDFSIEFCRPLLDDKGSTAGQ